MPHLKQIGEGRLPPVVPGVAVEADPDAVPGGRAFALDAGTLFGNGFFPLPLEYS